MLQALNIAAPAGDDLRFAAMVLGATVLLLLHFYPLGAARIEQRLLRRGAEPENAQARAVLRERTIGGLLFLVASALLWWRLFDSVPGWLLPRPTLEALGWVAVVVVVGMPSVVLSTRSPAMAAHYPEIRAATWSHALARQSLAGWLVYLLGYEALFRGLLAFGLTAVLGLWPGLTVMTAMYVLAHLRKAPAEAAVCFPMGFVFGLAALQTDSVWTPWLMHAAFSCTTEVLTARRNPAMHYPL